MGAIMDGHDGSITNPAIDQQVTQRGEDQRQHQVRAQQGEHLREGLPERWQRCDLHVGHCLSQCHRQNGLKSHAGNR